jgi:hypothetical protein
MAKRIARLLPGYSYGEDEFFAVDDAPPEIQARRRAGFARLSRSLRAGAPRSLALTAQAREGLSDLQLTGRYRVPFQFSAHVREQLPLARLPEIDPSGMVPLRASLMQMALGNALVVAVAERIGFNKNKLAVLHPGGSIGEKLQEEGAG